MPSPGTSRSTLTRTAIAVLATALAGLFTSCGSDASSSGPVTTEPVTTEPLTTDAGPDSIPATPPDATEPSTEPGEYGPATVRLDFDDRTLPVTEPLADGIYYSRETMSDGTTATLVLGQWFTCDASVPDEPSVLCASGFGTLDEPSAVVALAPDATVTINTGDLSNPTQADVSAGEFARLAAGDEPSAGAPDFTFYDFPTFVRVVDGVVVEANQIYTS